MGKGKSVPAPAVVPIEIVTELIHQKEPIQERPQAPDISKMSIVELKAAIFDQNMIMQNAQQNIQIISQELAKRQNESAGN